MFGMAVSAKFWREQEARYNLVGSHCKNCDAFYFPPREICPKCRRKGKMERYKFKGTGKILTYTIVHRPNSVGRSPYILAIIELDEGTRMLSEVICKPEEVSEGMKVRAVFRKLGEEGEEGIIYYGTKFVPA